MRNTSLTNKKIMPALLKVEDVDYSHGVAYLEHEIEAVWSGLLDAAIGDVAIVGYDYEVESYRVLAIIKK